MSVNTMSVSRVLAAEVAQRATDNMDDHSTLTARLPVTSPVLAHHPGAGCCSDSVYTLTLPMSNGTCHRRLHG